MNKNQRRLRRENRKVVRTKNREVVSQNTARNMQMVVVKEVNEAGQVVGSITRHIPINKDLPFVPHKLGRAKFTGEE